MAPPIPLLAQFYIRLGGSDVPAELMSALRSVEVDRNLYLPDMCVLEINDGGFTWADDPRLAFGQDLEIGARSADAERESPVTVFKGQIVGLEMDLRENGVAFLLVRAFDRLHLLQRGKASRTYTQVTDSDIATTIAQQHALQPSTDSTPHVYRHVYQHNVSDYEFLRARAERIGYVLRVEDRTLHFKKPQSFAKKAVELDYGDTLVEFHPRKSSLSQVKQAQVRGWNPQTKQPFVGQSSSADYQTVKTGNGRRVSAMVSSAYGVDPGEHRVTDVPISSQAEGDAVAKAELGRLWAGDIKAEGIAHGNPNIIPGNKVKVDGVGTQFGGEYFVTAVRHTLDAEGHFFSHFTVAGFEAATTADLIVEASRIADTSSGRMAQGLAIGIVTNNKDPEELGRVKVKFPWLADQTESDWARLVAPMAGNDRGFYWVPEVNDEVVVAFEHGDFNRPFIVGALWNGEDRTPLQSSEAVGGDGKVNKRIMKTRAGHVFLFDDTAGQEKIELIDKSGRNRIVIDSASGKITVEAQNDIEVKATNIKLDGKAKVAISAPQVEISGSGRVKIQGAMVELN